MNSVPLIPPTAPFSPDQRAWLNGFLAAWLGDASSAPVPSSAPQEPLLVLYGSQSGNAEGLAKRIGKESASQGFNAKVLEMAQAVTLDLTKEPRIICVTSTWGDGEMPDNAKPFWDLLNSDKAPTLGHAQVSVLALGDRNYPSFCQAGKDLETRLLALGAKRAHPLAECDVDYEPVAKSWIDSLWPALKGAPSNGAAIANGHSNGALPHEAPASKYDRKNPFLAKLKGNRLLNAPGSGKDVRHIEIDLAGSGLTYEVGDALGVFPQNDPALVEKLIQAQGWSGSESVPLPDSGTASITDALTRSYEITKLFPKFLEAAIKKGADLQGLLDPAKKKDLDAYLWGRDLLDLVLEFPQVKFAPEEFVGLLKKLNVRLYSIASSLKAHPEEVQLTVGAVRYDSHGRTRGGVCSTFLADRVMIGGPLPVFVQVSHGFRPPQNPETPMIMVGPGTGIAPFRAFLEERQAIGAKGKNWLFFGDQKAATDFLYQEELEAFHKNGYLTRLDTAFSRDQAAKIYVQNRMIENAKELWSWLESGAHFYVCGDASRMAKDVDAALHQVIQEQGGKSAEAAAEYVKQLKTDKRYQRDVY